MYNIHASINGCALFIIIIYENSFKRQSKQEEKKEEERKERSEKKWRGGGKKGRKKKETPSGIEARTLCVSVEASSYNHWAIYPQAGVGHTIILLQISVVYILRVPLLAALALPVNV